MTNLCSVNSASVEWLDDKIDTVLMGFCEQEQDETDTKPIVIISEGLQDQI